MSPGVRIESGHQKNACRPYGSAGISRKWETAFFHKLYLYLQLQNITHFPKKRLP